MPGTYEKVEEEEEEIYEVINIHKLKSAVPNLRCVNMYGIAFVDDSHVEAFSSNCIQLETLAVPYCNKVVGTTLKILFSRCKKLKTLLAPHTGSYPTENKNGHQPEILEYCSRVTQVPIFFPSRFKARELYGG